MLSKKFAGLFSFQRTGWHPPVSVADRPAVRGQQFGRLRRRTLATHSWMIRVLPNGGEYRARTGDLRLAKPALSQLS